jgi:hypothetical protein
MKNSLEARRQKLLAELSHVRQKIARTRKSLARLEARLALGAPGQEKAA